MAFFRSRGDQDPSAVNPMFDFDPHNKSSDKIFLTTTREWGADY